MIVTYKDWYEMLLYTLHAYHTIVRTFIGANFYTLVHRIKAMMPLEVEIPSLRILKDTELEESKWVKLKFE